MAQPHARRSQSGVAESEEALGADTAAEVRSDESPRAAVSEDGVLRDNESRDDSPEGFYRRATERADVREILDRLSKR